MCSVYAEEKDFAFLSLNGVTASAAHLAWHETRCTMKVMTWAHGGYWQKHSEQSAISLPQICLTELKMKTSQKAGDFLVMDLSNVWHQIKKSALDTKPIHTYPLLQHSRHLCHLQSAIASLKSPLIMHLFIYHFMTICCAWSAFILSQHLISSLPFTKLLANYFAKRNALTVVAVKWVSFWRDIAS